MIPIVLLLSNHQKVVVGKILSLVLPALMHHCWLPIWLKCGGYAYSIAGAGVARSIYQYIARLENQLLNKLNPLLHVEPADSTTYAYL